MKKMFLTLSRYYLCVWLIAATFINARAQKLPNVQQQSLRAPAGAKADGKLTEWGNQLQAYNRSSEIFYTVANNNDRLFFTVQAKNPNVIKKILLGGITFTVNSTGKKNDSGNMSVTFPLIKGNEGSSIGIKLSEQVTGTDSVSRSRQIDSLVRLMNADMGTKVKEIKVKGIKQIADTLLSVYNDDDIKAAVRFDHDKSLIYELALPLKYLPLDFDTLTQFNYHIILNGVQRSNISMVYLPSAKGMVTVIGTPIGLTSSGSSLSYIYPTDFWGEYVLAK